MISFCYKYLLKPILFRFDPEIIHDSHISIGNFLGKFKLTRKITSYLFNYKNSKLEQNILGLNFKNPVGLSEGFDKNGHLINILPHVGFGFTQVGSVTFKPYEGNPKPRLYRLPKSKSLVVYYGLKNEGVTKIAERIKSSLLQVPLSISIAKTNHPSTKETSAGIEDYVSSLKYLEKAELGNIFTLNISCPNTFGGEPFIDPVRLDQLLIEVDNLNISKPVLLKMPINLPWEEFRNLMEVVCKHKIQGVIIGNLNKDRKSFEIIDSIPSDLKGNLSGKATTKLSNALIAKTYLEYGEKMIIIGVGGIFNAADAYEKIKLGANLVQLITGMVFGGPQTIGEINRGIVRLLEKDGYSNISEAVGAYHKSVQD